MIGIIGGSGLYEGIRGLEGTAKVVHTPYGDVPVLEGENFLFISRHGKEVRPPHMVNYHANMMAFRISGVESVVAISSVGSLNEKFPPGYIFLPDDLLDFTGRVWTYHDEEAYHVNLYEPFCPKLREKMHERLGLPVGGTYATMKGPQFETRAERRMLQLLGADVVGMTVAPEAKLAKELQICYQPVCVVVNEVSAGTSHAMTLEMMKSMEEKIASLVMNIIVSL